MRLTKDIKTAILNAALKKAGIPDREAAIRSRVAAWASEILGRTFTPDVLAAIDHAKRVIEPLREMHPSFYLNTYRANYMNVNVAGVTRRVYFNGGLDSKVSLADVITYAPYNNPVLHSDDPLTEQLYAIDADRETLGNDKTQITASVNAVLDSVTTDKRLVEVWPEAVAFIPAAERAASPQLPALPIADLNRMIGLP